MYEFSAIWGGQNNALNFDEQIIILHLKKNCVAAIQEIHTRVTAGLFPNSCLDENPRNMVGLAE